MLDPRSEFRCKGNLRHPDGTAYRALGLIRLLMESKVNCILEAEIEADPFYFLVQTMNVNPPDHWDFSGLTDDGQLVVASGLSLRSQNPLHFNASEVIIGTVIPVSSIQFFFPNLDMTPRLVNVVEPTRAYSVPVPWQIPLPEGLGLGELGFYIRPDLDEVRTAAEEVDKSIFTATATLSRSDGVLDWVTTEEPVYRLCLLLSLATGRHISWAVAQSDNWWIYRRHVMSGWEGRGPTVWIKSFAESVRALLDCWSEICTFSVGQVLALRRALNLFLHSGPTFAFPVPFFCTAGAFEILCTAFLRDSRSGYLPDKPVFRTVRKRFEDWTTDHFLPEVTDENLCIEFRAARSGKFNAINSRNLRARILELASQLNLAHSEDDIGRFIKVRNEATHGTELTEQDEWELFTTLAPIDDLLVRVMLRLVGFDGEYWGGRDGFGTMRPLE